MRIKKTILSRSHVADLIFSRAHTTVYFRFHETLPLESGIAADSVWLRANFPDINWDAANPRNLERHIWHNWRWLMGATGSFVPANIHTDELCGQCEEMAYPFITPTRLTEGPHIAGVEEFKTIPAYAIAEFWTEEEIIPPPVITLIRPYMGLKLGTVMESSPHVRNAYVAYNNAGKIITLGFASLIKAKAIDYDE